VFNRLSEQLGRLADRLRGAARISESDLDKVLRELRITLLEADVALPVVRHLLGLVRERAIGAEVAKSLRPGQVIVKVLHDALIEILGKERRDLNTTAIPSVILLAGLQGSGKTTTAGKLARRLAAQGKKVALTSVDVTRPAAREQLQILAAQVDVPYVAGHGSTASGMARSALDEARRRGLHVLILDTAGRQVVDEALMSEISGVAEAVGAGERLIVLDAMTGQAALGIAEQFHAAIGLTGSILTKADADARGGAALSLTYSTGVPICFLGTGEKVDALEVFDPKRMAGRILGQGDVIGLVEKVQEHLDVDQAQKLARKAKRGGFDLMDFANQLGQLQKMGGMGEMLKMLPGMRIPEDKLAEVDDKPIRHMQAIVYSMTPKERRYPNIINGSRKRRIASGSGTSVQQVNQMLKQFTQMQKMMKKMKGARGRRMMAQMASRMGLPGMPRM
jgi:signal recognition particle subunit SRP54